jgi:UDP-glucuronate 4-epimerase
MRSLLERGHEVIGLDLGGARHRLAIALSDDQQALITHVQVDVTDLGALERVLDEYAITKVIHLAALQVPFVRENPVLGAQVNVTGTTNVLEAIRRRTGRIGPLVYASSIAALPLVESVDGASFVALLGGSVMGPGGGIRPSVRGSPRARSRPAAIARTGSSRALTTSTNRQAGGAPAVAR